MRLTKRKGKHVYINTEVIPRIWCKGESGFMMCQYQNRCDSVAERTCPALMVLDKLADLEDKEETTVDIKTEVAREIFAEISKRFETLLKDYPCNGDLVSAKKFIDVHWKYISNSIMSDYDTELKNKYTKELKGGVDK